MLFANSDEYSLAWALVHDGPPVFAKKLDFYREFQQGRKGRFHSLSFLENVAIRAAIGGFPFAGNRSETFRFGLGDSDERRDGLRGRRGGGCARVSASRVNKLTRPKLPLVFGNAPAGA